MLPPHVLADTTLVDALNVPLSFQTWRLLRHDQELTIAEARAVVVRLIEAILAHIDD